MALVRGIHGAGGQQHLCPEFEDPRPGLKRNNVDSMDIRDISSKPNLAN